MDLRQLRYFKTVADLGSYSAAANVVRISQPAISRQILKLEAEIGARLFVRHGHGVTLTEAGDNLRERCDGLLRQIDRLCEDIRDHANEPRGNVKIAVPPAAGHYLVPRLVESYQRSYPRVFLQILGGFSGYIREWLVSGRIDVGIMHIPSAVPGITVRPLLSEQVFLVSAPDAGFGQKKSLKIQDLADVPLILPSQAHNLRVNFEHLAASEGISLNLKMEVDGQAIIKTLVKNGQGSAVLTLGAIIEEQQRGELSVVPFDPKIEWMLGIAYREELVQTPTGEALVDTVCTICRELTESGEWPALYIAA